MAKLTIDRAELEQGTLPPVCVFTGRTEGVELREVTVPGAWWTPFLVADVFFSLAAIGLAHLVQPRLDAWWVLPLGVTAFLGGFFRIVGASPRIPVIYQLPATEAGLARAQRVKRIDAWMSLIGGSLVLAVVFALFHPGGHSAALTFIGGPLALVGLVGGLFWVSYRREAVVGIEHLKEGDRVIMYLPLDAAERMKPRLASAATPEIPPSG